MGDVPNVTFPCAALHDPATGRVAVYYGCADTVAGLRSAISPKSSTSRRSKLDPLMRLRRTLLTLALAAVFWGAAASAQTPATGWAISSGLRTSGPRTWCGHAARDDVGGFRSTSWGRRLFQADTAPGRSGALRTSRSAFTAGLSGGAFLLGSLLAGYYIARRGLRRTLSRCAVSSTCRSGCLRLACDVPAFEHVACRRGASEHWLRLRFPVGPHVRHQMAHYAFASAL